MTEPAPAARPRMVMALRASVDGKIALSSAQNLMQQPSRDLWNDLFPPVRDRLTGSPFEQAVERYGCGATLEGSGSLGPVGSDPAPFPRHPLGPTEPGGAGDATDLYEDFLPEPADRPPSPPHFWFTAVDARGRVRWNERHPGWSVLVLVSLATPPDYLGYLRRERISYLVAGDERVALGPALERMRSALGITCVFCTAGGELQSALLRDGLIDEVVLTVAPALVGGADTPSVLGGPGLAVGEEATRLHLLSVHTDTGGTVRMHYEVDRDG